MYCNDKCVVTNIRKVDKYNKVTINIIQNNKQSNTNTYIIISINKQYIIYFIN